MFGHYAVTMFDGKKVSLLVPTYREKNSLRLFLVSMIKERIFEEIIVVNNNAEIGTSETLIGLEVKEIFEKDRQGYGAAISSGLKVVTGDLVIICEPDGTFSSQDLIKFLAFSRDNDLVVGSRTVNQYIWDGANMGLFIKWGNWWVAKFAELILNTSYLSDVGCTYRLLSRPAVNYLNSRKLTDEGWYGLQQILEIIKNKEFRYTQIPVNYLPRVGVSSYTGSLVKTLKIGVMMIANVIKYRFKI